MRKIAVACLVLAALAWANPAFAAYGPARLLYTLKDQRIGESSGVESSSASRKVLFTHNDSGDIPRFFAIGPKGQTLATYTVLGAAAADWEDMTAGRGADGGPALFFGDIGDNFLARPFLTVYEVAEPTVDLGTSGAEEVVPITDVLHLVYEDGPHDAEALFVHPRTGALGIVTKDASGSSGVYLSSDVLPGFAMLHRVATISFKKIARPAQKRDFDATSRLQATGADMSPDGRRLVVRTYVEAFEWNVSKGLARGLAKKPLRIPLPRTAQGEAISYARDARALVTTSEQLPAPVHQVPPKR
jgi:hypothetical protein